MKSFRQESYERHAEHYRKYAAGAAQNAQARTWFDTDTVDAWRHRRMYQSIDPFLTADPGARWLTIGDGRYGKDAQYIIAHGGRALASDISDVLLKEALAAGALQECQRENAEALSFKDGEFDYVLCKEAYHHFPRPLLALYEMLRVASKGVVLIEPTDPWIHAGILEAVCRRLRSLAKRMLRRECARHCFEESGNYIYSVSRREIEKVALGLDCRSVAFKGINDTYIVGVEHEKLADNGPLQRRVRRRIALANGLCRLGCMDYEKLTAVVLKQAPPAALSKALVDAGYAVVSLPENPYVKA